MLQLVIVYASKDKRHADVLAKWLRPLERRAMIASIHAHAVTPGAVRAEEVARHMRRAEIIILLLSIDYLSPENRFDAEISEAVERHRSGQAVVIPVIVRAIPRNYMPFEDIQALPTNQRPVAKWSRRDEAWLDVFEGIEAAIMRLQAFQENSARPRLAG